jgi:phosphoribosylformylglycinamidine synthase II
MPLSPSDLEKAKQLLNREPTVVERHIFDTMWSEHCSYKSSKDILKKYLPTKGSEVALGIGEDAGIIRFTQHEGKQYCLAISHESHNHPSQILPVEGAATGVGGVVRDVYCMGADVMGVLNSLHFGIDRKGNNPLVDDIAQNVVLGVSDYANPLGVPVMGGETLFHESYNDNCLVNVAAIGLVEESKIIRSKAPKEAATEPYDVILVGKSTDTTGFGGASFSSATLDKENESLNIGAVQIHDPFLKRVLVESIKAVLDTVEKNNILIGFKDLGAGGISCATSEIAAAGGFGVVVNLDDVNVVFDNLPAEVIACSETQERFCLVVPRHFSSTVLKIFNEDFALPKIYPHAGAVVIGHITNEPEYVLMHKGVCVCRLPISAITTEVKEIRSSKPRDIIRSASTPLQYEKTSLKDWALALLALPNLCSKRYVYRFFDNAVRGHTVLYPGEADAVVSAPVSGSYAGVAASMDSNLYGNVDPYVSGAYAVAESIRNVVSVGARPIALTDCLNYGNPEKPSVFFDFEEGVKGIADAANHLGFIANEPLPVISGNVSFYNDSKQGTAVVPSPVIVTMGKLEDYRKLVHLFIQKPDLTLIVVGQRYAEFGATQIAECVPNLNTIAPQVRFNEEASQNKVVFDLIQNGKLDHCHDISMGGVWTAVLEMVLGERSKYEVGLNLSLPHDIDPLTALFSENGGYILAVNPTQQKDVLHTLAQQNIHHFILGATTPAPIVKVSHAQTTLFEIPLTELQSQREIRN